MFQRHTYNGARSEWMGMNEIWNRGNAWKSFGKRQYDEMGAQVRKSFFSLFFCLTTNFKLKSTKKETRSFLSYSFDWRISIFAEESFAFLSWKLTKNCTKPKATPDQHQKKRFSVKVLHHQWNTLETKKSNETKETLLFFFLKNRKQK